MKNLKYWDLTDANTNHRASLIEAAKLIQKGDIVAFPTETVYGLGADATNEHAVAKIFEAKGRPADNPLIAHVANKKMLVNLVTKVPTYAQQLIDAFTPGPITFILPSNGTCAELVTAGLPTIAVRIPDHPIAQQLISISQLPIAAPSANTSGKPSPTSAQHVYDDLSQHISGLIDGGETGIGVESTVIDCTNEKGPIILRPGGITFEEIQIVVPDVIIASADKSIDNTPLSPGMKYKHYEPDAPLILLSGTLPWMKHVVNEHRQNGKRVGWMGRSDTIRSIDADQTVDLGENMHDVARRLYNALRQFNNENIDIIFCEVFPREGIGHAIMNRLSKASTKMMKENE